MWKQSKKIYHEKLQDIKISEYNFLKHRVNCFVTLKFFYAIGYYIWQTKPV